METGEERSRLQTFYCAEVFGCNEKEKLWFLLPIFSAYFVKTEDPFHDLIILFKIAFWHE
jgi:hypothetical protein